MKVIKKLGIVLFSLILTILDVSFFSAMPVHGATIVTTFLVAIVLSLLLSPESLIIFAAGAVIFFSIFSSLPAWILIIGFFAIPEIVLYLRKTVVPEPTVPISFFFFVITNFIFELLLLLFAKEFNSVGFSMLGYFVLLNSVAGTFLYFLMKSFRNRIKVFEVDI